MAIRPVEIEEGSPFVGEECALCKQPFSAGDEIAICPDDATRHHVLCWQANGGRCTAYGCLGRGEIEGRIIPSSAIDDETSGSFHVKTLPERSFSCAQSCLLIAIAMAIILVAIGCFGLWAIADFFATEVMGWAYRSPISPAVLIPF